MLNPIALWKALRHFSLTFAVIFASTLLGASVTALLAKLLGHLPLPWLVLWILPMIIVAMVANREARWLPDENLRRRIAKRIVLGAVAVWAGLFVLRVMMGPKEPPPGSTSPETTPSRPVHRGPPGR
jgi:Mn2+/Fe2+ NRAMP family transporter